MVSVIICTYNQEKFIAQAIDSVLNQVCDEEMEILIGDDCSTDNTRSIVQQYYERYPQTFRLIYPQQNVGASLNIVNLIMAAKGEYIAIVDGDDVWIDPNKTQKQIDILRQRKDVGMVCAQAKMWEESKQRYTRILGNSYCESLHILMMRDEDVAAPTLFIRTELLRKCVEESEWYIKHNCFYDSIMSYWFAYKSQIVFIPENLAMYRVLDKSASHDIDEKLSIAYERRRFAVKCRFLVENKLDEDEVYAILMNEWDKTYRNALLSRDAKIRKTKTYRLGRTIMKPIQWIKDKIK